MFLDSSAWFEYFAGGRRGAMVKARLDGAAIAFSSPTVLAELYSKYTRTDEAAMARPRVEFIMEQTAVVDLTAEIGIEAGRIHAQQRRTSTKFSMADAFILAAARARNARLITFDRDFSGHDDVEVLADGP